MLSCGCEQGETNASWVMDGMLEQLLSNTELGVRLRSHFVSATTDFILILCTHQAVQNRACRLADPKESRHCAQVFTIVPMLNPDGVSAGNYRTSLAGVDLNRQWAKPSLEKHPEIANAKALLAELQA